MADEVKSLWNRYLSNLQQHPLRTKAITSGTSGVLAGSADMVAQKLAGAKNLQFKRSFLLMLYGFCYSGPFGHYFHWLMEKLVPAARDSKTIVIVEQLTSSPWNNFLFMTYLGMVVEGRKWSSVKSQLKSHFPSVQLNAWRFWPLVGLINYKYLPIQLRVLFHNLAAVCWGIFLILRSKASVPKLATA
uniref:Peroxisomal membrane protein PMP22 n=2 Tax=Physcomitrium patens TaxID=3218 RepID=A9T0K7_PHYPA|nr:hypothetical protein PHYPA_005943 [Physcomitrium patens]PNR55053.1 hypothetical protein PHYPA_005946 [Physcomitrium patens]